MKRAELLRHLRMHGCVMLREGGRHSWWHNPERNRRSAVPRHREIHDQLARKICYDLGVPPVNGARRVVIARCPDGRGRSLIGG